MLPIPLDEKLCVVIGFDPGESTGFCVLGVRPEALLRGDLPLHEQIELRVEGTISCHSPEGQRLAAGKHAGLNMFGENTGISEMLDVVRGFKTAAIVVEDFIPDMKKMDQARHTLSPVRLMAGFSYGLSVEWQEWGMNEELGLGEERIFVQNRSLAKTTCTDERLKKWGLYSRHETRHARDAMRHAFYFLRTAHNVANQIESSSLARFYAWPQYFEDPMITKKTKRKRPVGDRI